MNEELLREKVRDIEEGFSPYLPAEEGYAKTVLEAMNYSVRAGGKRLRPMFMQAMYAMLGGADEKAIRPFMMAIEMIHTYSLVHDDLPAMDNDDYRRGKPTTHKKYGEAMGILAGDALLNAAYETAFLAFDSGTDNSAIGRALQVLGRKSGIYGMVGGQVADVENNGHFADRDCLFYVHRHKTAALIECSLMVGAILAGASERDVTTAESIGVDIGMAFQIQDDILDVVGQEELLGKPVHSDERNEKTTYVSLYGLDKSRELVKQYTDSGLSLLSQLETRDKEAGEFLYSLLKSLVKREW